MIHITVHSYNNVFVHLNNGTNMKNAENAIQVNSFNTGLDFYYRPRNNVNYLIFVASGANPSVNVSISLDYLTDQAYQA